jgi:Luciferase-like monooxygenase
MRRCALAGGGVAFRGGQHTVDYAAGPVPPAPVPLWLGGVGPRMLAVSGRSSDGWISPLSTYLPPPAVPARQRLIDEAARSAGRDPAAVRRIYNVVGAIGAGCGGPGWPATRGPGSMRSRIGPSIWASTRSSSGRRPRPWPRWRSSPPRSFRACGSAWASVAANDDTHACRLLAALGLRVLVEEGQPPDLAGADPDPCRCHLPRGAERAAGGQLGAREEPAGRHLPRRAERALEQMARALAAKPPPAPHRAGPGCTIPAADRTATIGPVQAAGARRATRLVSQTRGQSECSIGCGRAPGRPGGRSREGAHGG